MAFYTPQYTHVLEWVTLVAGGFVNDTFQIHRNLVVTGAAWAPKRGLISNGSFRPATDTEILAAKLMGDYV